MSGLFRQESTPGRRSGGDRQREARAGDNGHPRSPADVVAHGVDLAYRVSEEQIELGKRIAQQVSDRNYDLSSMSTDFRELADRTLRTSMDLTALWMELLGSISQALLRLSPGLIPEPMRRPASGSPSGAERATSGRPGADSPGDSASATVAFALDVSSRRPTRVKLDLHPGAGARELASHGLRTVDPKAPALSEIGFRRGSGGSSVVRIEVSDELPTGLYTGAVFDRQSGEAMGTLSVRVLD